MTVCEDSEMRVWREGIQLCNQEVFQQENWKISCCSHPLRDSFWREWSIRALEWGRWDTKIAKASYNFVLYRITKTINLHHYFLQGKIQYPRYAHIHKCTVLCKNACTQNQCYFKLPSATLQAVFYKQIQGNSKSWTDYTYLENNTPKWNRSAARTQN